MGYQEANLGYQEAKLGYQEAKLGYQEANLLYLHFLGLKHLENTKIIRAICTIRTICGYLRILCLENF